MERVRVNNQITAPELQVVDDTGKNLGVLSLDEAKRAAQERGLDLIEIAPEVRPPVAKIMDYGKFLYQRDKKKKGAKKSRVSRVREIKIKPGTSQHDMEMKAKKISEFLDGGDKVRVALILRGRSKYLDKNFMNDRLKNFLSLISTGYKIADGPRQGPTDISATLEHGEKNK